PSSSQHNARPESGGRGIRHEPSLLLGIRLFFFSSRRRHTRWPRDWSSDVCSSDLLVEQRRKDLRKRVDKMRKVGEKAKLQAGLRSEERRVGKECRSRGGRDHEKKRKNGDRG